MGKMLDEALKRPLKQYATTLDEVLALRSENGQLRAAVELAEQVFSKLERGGMPSISYGETLGVLRRALCS